MVSKAQRDIRRKRQVLEYAVRIRNIRKTCRHFGIPRSLFYVWRGRSERSTFPFSCWGAGLAVDVLDAVVREVPMQQRLELMAAVGAHRVNAEGKRPDHVV